MNKFTIKLLCFAPTITYLLFALFGLGNNEILLKQLIIFSIAGTAISITIIFHELFISLSDSKYFVLLPPAFLSCLILMLLVFMFALSDVYVNSNQLLLFAFFLITNSVSFLILYANVSRKQNNVKEADHE